MGCALLLLRHIDMLKKHVHLTSCALSKILMKIQEILTDLEYSNSGGFFKYEGCG